MPKIILHGATGSPFVGKVKIVLAEKGLAYEQVPTIPVAEPPAGGPFPGLTSDLKAHTPLGKIPFMQIDGRWLADSSVIAAYLDRLHPDPPLYPPDAWDYAQTLWFEEYIDGGAVPRLFNTIFFERLLAPLLLGRATDNRVVENAMQGDLPLIYGYLNEHMEARTFLAGTGFSVADAAAASFFMCMQQADAAPNTASFPHLARYIAQLHCRPSVRSTRS